ncbi:MAG: hypothetical protein OXD39_08690 [Gemmatimonadetes bacterium]|nr:hypothetical protein [Gemmatimonadota bacterium]
MMRQEIARDIQSPRRCFSDRAVRPLDLARWNLMRPQEGHRHLRCL